MEILFGVSCFKLLFTAVILEEILVYTNKEIDIQRENYNDKSHAVLSNLEMDELEAFLGLSVLSAALKDNHLATHMMFDTTYCGERYKATMSERRFKFILNCLRFDDKETRTARREMTKLAPVSSIWDKLLNNCRVNYKAGSYITIDEQLVGFRGKCPFRMYIPSKPNKYGIKIVMSCDSGTKYMLDAIVYLGKGSVPPAMAAGEYYVLELLKNVKGTNRNVTIDNWFTSVPLIQRLRHEYKITTVGTIKKNKPQLPIEATDIKFQKRAASTSLFIFHEDLTVVSYKPNNNKLVLLASSMHSTGSIHETTGKPEIVHVYNSTKGGVDNFDQMCQNINHGRKTRRWPLAFFQNMMNIAAINAYIIYAHNMCSRGQKPESRLNFMLSLHKELTEGFQSKRLATNTNMSLALKKSIQNIVGASQEAHSAGEDQKGPRKYCNFCSYTKRRYTTTYCNCGLAICGEHAQKKCPECA